MYLGIDGDEDAADASWEASGAMDNRMAPVMSNGLRKMKSLRGC
jgi:hypothetical protein